MSDEMRRDTERETLIASIENLVPPLPAGADGYRVIIGGGRFKYLQTPRAVAEEIVDIACCLEVCRIEGYGVWDAEKVRWEEMEDQGGLDLIGWVYNTTVEDAIKAVEESPDLYERIEMGFRTESSGWDYEPRLRPVYAGPELGRHTGEDQRPHYRTARLVLPHDTEPTP